MSRKLPSGGTKERIRSLWKGNTVQSHYNVVNFLTNIYKSSPVRVRYEVSFVDPESDWYFASISVIINEISYNIGLCYNSTRLWMVNNAGPHWWKVNIGSGNGLVSSGNKPLPGPMLTEVHDTKRRHLATERVERNFYWTCKPCSGMKYHILVIYVNLHILTYLPSLEANTWMEADIVEETRVDEGESEIRHATQFD